MPYDPSAYTCDGGEHDWSCTEYDPDFANGWKNKPTEAVAIIDYTYINIEGNEYERKQTKCYDHLTALLRLVPDEPEEWHTFVEIDSILWVIDDPEPEEQLWENEYETYLELEDSGVVSQWTSQ